MVGAWHFFFWESARLLFFIQKGEKQLKLYAYTIVKSEIVSKNTWIVLYKYV